MISSSYHHHILIQHVSCPTTDVTEKSEGRSLTVYPPRGTTSPGPGLLLEQSRCPARGCIHKQITITINHFPTDARV